MIQKSRISTVKSWNKKVFMYFMVFAMAFSLFSYPSNISADVVAPTFTVSETGTLTFDALTQGYTSAQTVDIQKYVTLTKVGNGTITNLSASFSGGAGSKFIMGTVPADTLGAGVLSTQVNIRPKTSLAVGTHTETLTFTADGGIIHSFNVSFTVNPSPTTFTVSETGTLTLAALTQGYSFDDTIAIQKYVTLTKVGNGAITNLRASFSGGASSKFIMGTVPADTLGAGVLSTQVNIRPKTSLAVGTHTETVTFTADGGIIHSFTVSFTVNSLVHAATPIINIQPTDHTVDIGTSVDLDVSASISDNGTLDYQWFSNTTNNTIDGTPIVGANSASYEVPTDIVGTIYYYVGVININNSVNGTKIMSTISDAAQVTVNPIVNAATPSITTQPADQTVYEGSTAALNVGASVGDSGTLSYQWYSNSTGSNSGGTPIVDANSASYEVPTDIVGANYYYVVVTNTNNSVNGMKKAAITSDAAQVIVTVAPVYMIGNISNQNASSLVQGYVSGTQEAKTILLENTGTGKLTGLAVALSGSGSDAFEITQPDSSVDSVAPATSFTIKAKDGLTAGTYITTVTVSANQMTSVTFTMTQVVSTPNGNNSNNSSSNNYNSNTGPTTTHNGVIIFVNGKAEQAGIATNSQRVNQTVTTIVIDPVKLNAKIATEGEQSVVTIRLNKDSDIVVAQLNGQLIKNMVNKQAILELQTDRATYRLPADLLHLDEIVAQLGTAKDLEKIKVHFEIAEPTADTLQVVNNTATSGNFTLVAPAFEFTVSVIDGTKTVSVIKFNAYVERTIAIPEGVDPNKITTGVAIEADGSVRHVPTKIVMNNGQYYAKINSLTNSTYAVVWNPIQFTDMSNHWAQTVVNDMGSRLIINGTGGDNFSPDQNITRAEFAAIIVRGLGMKMDSGDVPFSDIGHDAWYSKAVQTAQAYGLINGYANGTFRPDDVITREAAMIIIAKAMDITGLKEKLPVQSRDETIQSYVDAGKASTWALDSIVDSIHAGIVTGRRGNELAPQASITRAEVAVMIQRLLQQSSLI